eukprot:5895934-Amphidinium_carterae.1
MCWGAKTNFKTVGENFASPAAPIQTSTGGPSDGKEKNSLPTALVTIALHAAHTKAGEGAATANVSVAPPRAEPTPTKPGECHAKRL